MKNKVRELWAEDKAVVNGWLSIPSTVTAEINARAGFDSLTVDLQHGLNDYQSALSLLRLFQLVTRLRLRVCLGWSLALSASCLMPVRSV